MTTQSTKRSASESPFGPLPSAGSTSAAQSASATPSTNTTDKAASSPSTSGRMAPSRGSATTANGQVSQEATRRAQDGQAPVAGHPPTSLTTTACHAPNPGQSEPVQSLTEAHRQRLRERKLDPDLCLRLGVHSLPGAIGFTYRGPTGDIHNIKIRRGKGDMPWMHAGRALILWNSDCLADEPAPDESVILTEGEFDAVALIQAGFSRVVSVPNGAQTGEQGFKYLYDGGKLMSDLDKFGSFVIATDGDERGLACRDALAIRLGEERCRHVVWPADCKDANDVLKAHGAEALAQLVYDARPMLTDEVCTMDDVPEPGQEVRYRVGIPELDHHGFRITLPAFWPIIGPYGSGKSVLLRQIIVSLWRLHGWPCLLTSFEERIKPRYQRDLRRNLINRPMLPDAPWTEAEIAAADDEIRRGFVFLRRKKFETLDLDRLIDRIEYAVRVYGVRVVAIDPVNEIDHRYGATESRTEYMGRFIRSLKALGEDYSLLIICLAHPPKDSVEKRLQKNGILTLNDGADTAHWGNKADIGWCVWRDLGDGPTMLHVDKIKDHETMGRPTMAELHLDRALNQFRVGRMGFELMARSKGASE